MRIVGTQIPQRITSLPTTYCSKPAAQQIFRHNLYINFKIRSDVIINFQMQLIKSQNSFEKESSIEKERERRSLSRSKEEEKTVRLKEERSVKDDVNFMIQVISKI